MIYSADGSAVINAHLTDENAHKDEFAKYLPLAGGKMTGRIIAPASPSGTYVPIITSKGGNGEEPLGCSSLRMDDTQVWLRLQPTNSVYHDIFMNNNGVTLSAVNIEMTPGETSLVVNANTGTVQVSNASKIANDNDVTTKKYVDDAVNAAHPAAHKVTLSASGWDGSAKTQTVSCADIVADETAQQILPMPAAASMSTYNDAGILCTGQGAGTLTFTAETVPTADIQVFVTITPVQFS